MTEPFGKLAPLIEPARRRISDAVDTYVSSPSLTGSRSHTHRDLGNKLDPNGNRKKDEAEQDLTQLNHLIRVIKHRHQHGYDTRHHLQQLRIIINRWIPTANAADYIARRTPTPNDGCISCARVKTSQGTPLWSPRSGKHKLCRSCLSDLARVRARKGHEQAELVPTRIIDWRQRYPGKQIDDARFDRLLNGKLHA